MSDANYTWYKDHGICISCKEFDAVKGKTKCEVCLLQQAEKRRIRLTKETDEARKIRLEKNKAYKKKLYLERKENSLCVNCAKPICSGSTVYCIDCFLKSKRNVQKQQGNGTKSTMFRKEHRLCIKCGELPLKGKKLCEKHYNIAIGNLNSENAEAGRQRFRDYERELNREIFNN